MRARAISRRADQAVKPQPAPQGPPRAYATKFTRRVAALARAGAVLIIAATCAPSHARPAPSTREPLCDWLSGIGEAAQAQGAGDPGAAELAARRALDARPRGAAGARASAALGLALAARGEPADAADALEVALGGPPVPARAHLATWRGEALLAAGDAPRAAALLGDAARATGLSVSRRARQREAEALLGAGLAGEAVPLLEALAREAPSSPQAPAARLGLGRALRAVGEERGAAEVLRALWLELPSAPEGRAAGAALDGWRAAGGPVPHAAGEERLLRAERLLAEGWPEQALVELGRAADAEPPHGDPALAEVLRASALLALGRHADAERLAAPLADAEGEPARRGARLVLGRAAARAGRLEEASRRYAEVAALTAPIPGLPAWRQRDIGDEAGFLAAWLFYDASDFARAAEALEEFARRNPRSRRAEDARWFAAWSLYRLGRGAEASRALAGLAQGPLADASAYWRARLARDPARRKALYRAAVRASGDGWYAVLARARLAELGEAAPRAAAAPSRPLPEEADPRAAGRLSVAVELLGLGLRADALAELSDLPRPVPARASAPLVAQLAAFAGDAELPFRMARDHLGPTRRALRWAWPEPYPDVLPARARAFGVDPWLVLATMRQESGFRPAVRSAAGAEGLLQLLPSTAERLGALLGLPPGAGARLAEPELNVTLAAHYLGLLADRFHDPAIALAAYNAGPRPAAEWARTRAGMPLDAWVESIPYRETRAYVKTVLAGWDTYRALAGEPPPAIDPGAPVLPPGPGAAF